jgi:hypothetical protein
MAIVALFTLIWLLAVVMLTRVLRTQDALDRDLRGR